MALFFNGTAIKKSFFAASPRKTKKLICFPPGPLRRQLSLIRLIILFVFQGISCFGSILGTAGGLTAFVFLVSKNIYGKLDNDPNTQTTKLNPEHVQRFRTPAGVYIVPYILILLILRGRRYCFPFSFIPRFILPYSLDFPIPRFS